MRVSSGPARATKLISDVFFVLRTVRALLAFVDPQLKRSLPRSLDSLQRLLNTYGGSLKSVYLPDNVRLEEEEEEEEEAEENLENAGDANGESKAGDGQQPQAQLTVQPQQVPTTAQEAAPPNPVIASPGLGEGGEEVVDEEELDEQVAPNECAELINHYDLRVREHCAALEQAIAHLHQNVAPVAEKVHTWREAAKALHKQMAEQVVRNEPRMN